LYLRQISAEANCAASFSKKSPERLLSRHHTSPLNRRLDPFFQIVLGGDYFHQTSVNTTLKLRNITGIDFKKNHETSRACGFGKILPEIRWNLEVFGNMNQAARFDRF
jgi:hypothetical protein